jgi:uncharacterized phosphosugar-binding protein
LTAERYLNQAERLVHRIHTEQVPAISRAAELMSDAIGRRRAVYVFGSGHSVIPVLDIFPRYGSFVGFRPLLDPRLMWFNTVGAGGARELLWLERAEGYARVFLSSYPLDPDDVMLVYSHGGLNAAPVEVAQEAKRVGMPVVAVTSAHNAATAAATHSSGMKLADVADVVIDNCVPREDALVQLDGRPEPLAAGSTLAFVCITMALVAEVGTRLAACNHPLDTFVSPNVPGVAADHNAQVFVEYERMLRRLDIRK